MEKHEKPAAGNHRDRLFHDRVDHVRQNRFYYPFDDYYVGSTDRREEKIMFLTPFQTILMILAIAAGTILTRFIPFVLFPEGKEVPAYISYLGTVLPPAMMGLLVVYCLKGVSLIKAPHGIPEALATPRGGGGGSAPRHWVRSIAAHRREGVGKIGLFFTL